MIQSRNIHRRHGASQIKPKSNLFRVSLSPGPTRFSRSLLSIAILGCAMFILAWASLDQLDRSIYPGCKVLSQDGKLLTIELDPQLNTGSDSACQAAGRLIYKICQDGYAVIVANSSLANIGEIDLEKAYILSK